MLDALDTYNTKKARVPGEWEGFFCFWRLDVWKGLRVLRVLPVQEKIDRYAISMEDLVSMRYSLLSAVKYVLAGFLFFSWVFFSSVTPVRFLLFLFFRPFSWIRM